MGVEYSTTLGCIRNSQFGIHSESSHQHRFVQIAVLILVLEVVGRDSVVRVPRHNPEMSLDPLFDQSSGIRYYSAGMGSTLLEVHRIEFSESAEAIKLAL